MTDRPLNRSLWIRLALLWVMIAARPVSADDPCVRPICRSGYHFEHGRCETPRDPLTGAMSHYDPEPPLCPDGWRVEGRNCLKIICCERQACDDDERYREGYCHSGPTFFGWRAHHRATCDEGWALNEATGICHLVDCPGRQPPPPAVAAGPDDGPPPDNRRRREQPPPPAVAAGPDDPPPKPRPDRPAPPPPVVNPAEVTRLLPSPCVDRGGTVTIEGGGFGREQGERRAVLGGHGISVTLRITVWSDERISAVVPDDERIDYGQWYYIGIQNADGNWISNLSATITICRGLE
jgi:hypothetical protein